jgi:hypothetical protein
MAMDTCDLRPGGFSSHYRRWGWVRFCTRGPICGANLIPSGFVDPSLVLLNLNPVPMVPVSKLKQTSSSQ